MGLTRSRDRLHHGPDGLHLEFSSYLASFPREPSYLITLSGIFSFLIFLFWLEEVKVMTQCHCLWLVITLWWQELDITYVCSNLWQSVFCLWSSEKLCWHWVFTVLVYHDRPSPLPELDWHPGRSRWVSSSLLLLLPPSSPRQLGPSTDTISWQLQLPTSSIGTNPALKCRIVLRPIL